MSLYGITPIISVPFLENEVIDFDSFKDTIIFLSKKVKAAILFGIASEYIKLSDIEKQQLVKIALEHKGSMKLYTSITDHGYYNASKNMKQYEQMGVDGFMILGPFLYQTTTEQLMSHIEKLVTNTSLPCIIQVAPKETGQKISNQEIKYLNKLREELYFKIEGPQIYKFIEELLNESPEIKVLNGYAGIYMDKVLKSGAIGIVPGCSFVEIYLDLYNNLEKNNEEFKEKFQLLLSYIDIWMQSTEKIISVEKYILAQRKVIKTGCCRQPFYDLDKTEKELINNFIMQFKLEEL